MSQATSITSKGLSNSPTSRNEAGSNGFSFLTCLFVGGVILVSQTLIDFDTYFEGANAHTLGPWLSRILETTSISPVYGYAAAWWPSIFLISLTMGCLLGWRGVLYSVCGVLIFLVVIHNFRGITARHNVFEWADNARRMHYRGYPDPSFWDYGFFAMSVIGGCVGWILNSWRLQKKPTTRTLVAIGQRPAVIVSVICVIVGVVEAYVTTRYAQPGDSYPFYPRMTHCYALFGYGIFTGLIAQFKQAISDVTNLQIQ